MREGCYTYLGYRRNVTQGNDMKIRGILRHTSIPFPLLATSCQSPHSHRTKTMPAQEEYVLPSQEALQNARSSLLTSIPTQGIGFESTQQHLQQDIVPGLNGNSKSPRYYGFVTGGATPIATFADKLAVDLMVLSTLPLAKVSPSGLMATEVTLPE